MARPSLSSDELRERIESELAEEIPIALVAQHVGVARSTLFEWIRRGQVVRRLSNRRDPLTLVQESPAETTSAPTPADLDERLRAAEPGLIERSSAPLSADPGKRRRGSWSGSSPRAGRSRRVLQWTIPSFWNRAPLPKVRSVE